MPLRPDDPFLPVLPFAPAMLRLIVEVITLTAIIVIAPGIREPTPFPIWAGFKPILPIWLSILRATRVSATTNTSHTSTPPDAMLAIADIMSFRNTIFIIIITSIDPYIRHQPLNISFVFLLPPIANASGAKKVSTDVMT